MPETNQWQFIETQSDLDKLDSRFYWSEGARVVELYGCMTTESYFPKDVSYSGKANMNIHLLIELDEIKNEGDPSFVEFVLIDCDHINSLYLSRPHFKGRVDTLKRIDIQETVMRCSRLIYRYVYRSYNPHISTYFKVEDSVS